MSLKIEREKNTALINDSWGSEIVLCSGYSDMKLRITKSKKETLNDLVEYDKI